MVDGLVIVLSFFFLLFRHKFTIYELELKICIAKSGLQGMHKNFLVGISIYHIKHLDSLETH